MKSLDQKSEQNPPVLQEKGPPKRRSREQSIRKLLKAGLEVFSKYGFDAATTKQISKKAGLNDALIARYFESKVGLLRSIILDFVERSKESAKHYPKGESLEEELRNLFKHKLQHALEHRDFTRIAISRIVIDTKLGLQLEKLLYSQPNDIILNRLKEFQLKGEISPDRDLIPLFYSIQMQCSGIIFMSTVSNSYDRDLILETIDSLALNLALGLKVPVNKI